MSPIPQQPNAEPVPAYIGGPALPRAVAAAPIPQNANMAPNPNSNMHDDTYMSDTSTASGPLGGTPKVTSTFLGMPCGAVAFDAYNRIVTECQSTTGNFLYMLDPTTLATVASLSLPPSLTVTQQFPGAYFYLDALNRLVVVTSTNEVWIVAETGGTTNPQLVKQSATSLSSVVPSTDSVISVEPDGHGHLWFVTRGGIVGVFGPGMPVAAIQLSGEQITNSFAVDPAGGVYIASDTAMYRFDLGSDGQPGITWRAVYDRGTRAKPGQLTQGTGTTPTLMGSDYVTITDNADPYENVLVYRRAPTTLAPRLACSQPVFTPYQGATEASEIATDTSIVVENNYGYSPASTRNGATTVPGITRVVLYPGGSCYGLWTAMESVPNAVSRLSQATGLIYTYTKSQGPDTTDAWYFTAIDFVTGATVFKVLAGTGRYYDSHGSNIALGRDGTAYIGVIGGLVAVRDRP